MPPKWRWGRCRSPVVTGGSRGFGRALAVDLAKDGWDLIIDGRHRASLEDVGATLAGLGRRSALIAGDVTESRSPGGAHRGGGAVRLVWICWSTTPAPSGPVPCPRLERYPLDALRRVYEVNVLAPLALVQAALPLLRRAQRHRGRLSSDAAVEAYEGWGGYGSSKAALDQLHQVLAAEEPELRIYQFDPGDMRTEMHQAAFPGEDISDRPEPESVVAPLPALLASDARSGRYRAADWWPAMTALADPVGALTPSTCPHRWRRRSRPRPEGSTRDAVRMLVSYRCTGSLVPSSFDFLPQFLEPGDLLVINTSGTIPAAIDAAGR